MPGLSQLKQFSSDLLALGDEVTTRASRGEQPLKVEIPSSVEDVNDSEEFVLGMPEVEAEVEEEFIDDDLSELAGITGSTSGDAAEDGESPVASFEAPDMADLLEPVAGGDFDGAIMPDLSMFADEPEEAVEEYVEEEPEEVSIADMGLEDLLSGGGFDEPEAQDDDSEFEVPVADENLQNESELEIEPVSEPEIESVQESNLIDDLGDFEDIDEVTDLDDLGDMENLGDLGDLGDANDNSEDVKSSSEPEDDFELPNDLPNIDDFETPAGEDDFASIGEMPDFTEPIPDMTSEDIVMPAEDQNSTESDNNIQSADEDFSMDSLDGMDLPDMDIESSSDFDSPIEENEDQPVDVENNEEKNNEEDFSLGIPEGLFDANDLDSVQNGSIEATDNGQEKVDDFGDLGDLGDLDQLGDLDNLGEIGEASASDDFGIGDDSVDIENSEVSEDLDSFDESNSSEPFEVFDTSEMEGINFDDIPDTDTQLSQNADDDSQYDLKSDDDFAFGSEFEIPGFSDVETVKEQKSGKIGGKSDFKDKKHKAKKQHGENVIQEENEDELPPNTLSDRQYKIFKQNLSEYPLNVRLAFEDFLVQDEFTDDAEFEVIEKILNKAPARQVASTLEKMLDISIPVPRDFEHRSAEEYEEYKKSISYQLKNKIIPAALIFIVGVFVCIGLFNFGKNCIYKPIRANSLYKQGYVLLQESEYPLSEIKFNQATNYRLNKKWFFKYARGYREHKQYQRAAKMYENILFCFKHDKKAGLEYADMELDDLANYERAEEIVRREVLDYHINDADGILKLGDVFLEWGTEKDPSKLEQAREQYATLLQLYGQKDLYLSRMMRYFIRSDNLREVLQLKQHFEPEEESLCSDDWTELSGYLLEKYYGELAPSEEYLRYEIEGLRGLLLRAVHTNPENPIALYNLSKYFINTNEIEYIESTLQTSIEKFNAAKKMKKRDIYKYIDAYRLLGEHYIETEDFLQSQEQFSEGISLYVTERDHAGFEGTPQIGQLYEDMGNLKYTISGDYDEALMNYTHSVDLGNDSPKIRYRIGYIQYHNKKYAEALGSFMRAGDGNIKERNLLLAMANTLSLRGDDYAAEGYYNQLIETLDSEIAERGLVLPQASVKDFDVVNTYLSAANNYGVTLYRLAKKTGDSSKNAEAIVQFSQSLRAWDALTRNQETMIRLPGSNLAEQNIKYITHPIPEFEPAIYTDISKTLLDNEKL